MVTAVLTEVDEAFVVLKATVQPVCRDASAVFGVIAKWKCVVCTFMCR